MNQAKPVKANKGKMKKLKKIQKKCQRKVNQFQRMLKNLQRERSVQRCYEANKKNN